MKVKDTIGIYKNAFSEAECAALRYSLELANKENRIIVD